jgi:hypothetical protein
MDKASQIRNIISSGKISNKADFYLLYHAGILGNKALAWSSYQELLKSNWKGSVCLRSKKGVLRGRVDYNVPFNEVYVKIDEWEREGYSLDSINFNQSMPDDNLILQGEVIDDILGWDLRYTTVKKPMNLALDEKENYAKGLAAKMIMRGHLDPSSYSDIEALFGIFPNSAIEFSTYSISVGDIQNRNTVIWEVRNY